MTTSISLRPLWFGTVFNMFEGSRKYTPHADLDLSRVLSFSWRSDTFCLLEIFGACVLRGESNLTRSVVFCLCGQVGK